MMEVGSFIPGEHRIITVIWHRPSNTVELVPDDSLSYYDVCGVLSQALDIAAQDIPDPCLCDLDEEAE